MRRPHRLTRVLTVAAVFALTMGVASCGGGGGTPDLVLVGFNVPNVSGIPLNQPLIFTFSSAIDEGTITPDTLRVVGALGPNFETTVVDGNLVALLPRNPNFEDYSDAGLLAGVQYTVSMALFPAPSTITATDGKPLLDAESFQFNTTPVPTFIEPSRPIQPGDADGCLNNPSLDDGIDPTVQFGSGPGARLLCLQNQGPPQIILAECTPTHNAPSVGNPSAVTPGYVNLPALRIRLNEPLDPITVVPYSATEKRAFNVQLWYVGNTDRDPLSLNLCDPLDPEIVPVQVRTNKPLIVQSLDQTEIILGASNELLCDPHLAAGGVPQGTYMINLTGAVTDLPGNSLSMAEAPDRDTLTAQGYDDIDDFVTASGVVPPGFRYYFVTLLVPATPLSIIETYTSQSDEYGNDENHDGVFTYSNTPSQPQARIVGSTSPTTDSPSYTLTALEPGQSTTATWNNSFRFLGIDTLVPNTDVDSGAGVLKAVYRPHLGDGRDGVVNSGGGGTIIPLNTDDGSEDDDGIYEFESFSVGSGDTVFVSGSKPLVILCRGNFVMNGTLDLSGMDGGDGLDTDGAPAYENPASIALFGAGGAAGSGGGAGGSGGDPMLAVAPAGSPGLAFTDLFGDAGSIAGGGAGTTTPSGGGGGGFDTAGGDGTTDGSTGAGNAGPALPVTERDFRSFLSETLPDRTYFPNAKGSGGTGAGGGGVNTTPVAAGDLGNDGGAGGGGGGGGLYVIAGGSILVGGSIITDGGDGGDTYAVEDQEIDLGDDGVVGGEDANADTVTGISGAATPSGHGGAGGGGSGGGIFLGAAEGVTISTGASISANGGSGGMGAAAAPTGGVGGSGTIIFAAPTAIPVDVAAGTVSPAQTEITFNPTIEDTSVGQSIWYNAFTFSTVFQRVSWVSNFETLETSGVTMGVDYEAHLEMQGALDYTQQNPPAADTAIGLTAWIPIYHTNDPALTRVEAPDPGLSQIDGRPLFRYRWRFVIYDTYPVDTVALPQVSETRIEFER